jgi:hypothetical protein
MHKHNDVHKRTAMKGSTIKEKTKILEEMGVYSLGVKVIKYGSFLFLGFRVIILILEGSESMSATI